MEIGAVMAAAPRKNVIRETSDPGDVIILMGGRTGRDGIGGATGSSKVHTEESIEVCAQRFRREMHQQNVNYRDCSAARRSAV